MSIIFYKGRRVTPDDVNVWGTLKELVGEGFCKECERPESEGHYTNCPLYVRPRRGCVECGSTGAHKLDCSKRAKKRRRRTTKK